MNQEGALPWVIFDTIPGAGLSVSSAHLKGERRQANVDAKIRFSWPVHYAFWHATFSSWSPWILTEAGPGMGKCIT
jgi:hypothetical protein